MWWLTGILIAMSACLAVAALLPWARQFRPDGAASTGDAVPLRVVLRSRPRSSALTALVAVPALVVACVNFASTNTLSVGLAANWAFGTAVAAVVAVCLMRSWSAFPKPDWRVFRRTFFVAIAVLWLLLAITAALSPPRTPDDPSGIAFGVLVATAFAPIWVPFIGVPVATVASYVTTALIRRRSPARI